MPPSISVGEAETYAATNGIMEFMHHSYITDEMAIPGYPSPIPVQMDSTVAEIMVAGVIAYSVWTFSLQR